MKQPKWELEIIGADGSSRRYECARSEAEATIASYIMGGKAHKAKFRKQGDQCTWVSNRGTILRVYLYGEPAVGVSLDRAQKAYRSKIARADRELRDNSAPKSAVSKRGHTIPDYALATS